MTVFREYQRLEAQGLWRASPDAQARDVIVSVGEATLTLTDMQDRPLAHWSLAAVARANPGQRPALYHPDGDPGETLELATDEGQMIAAIERVRGAIARRRPRPGRLRLTILLSVLAVLSLAAAIWLPQIAQRHALKVLPQVKREEIGTALLRRLERVAGAACHDPGGDTALKHLAARLPREGEPTRLIVLRDMPGTVAESALALPGGIVVLDRALLEDHDEPDIAAGHIVAAYLRAEERPPMASLLEASGLWATLRLLATGQLPQGTLDTYAEGMLSRTPPQPDDQALLAAFARYKLRARPYAYALDITGESVLPLIEADPYAPPAAPPPPVLRDADWLRLQSICGA